MFFIETQVSDTDPLGLINKVIEGEYFFLSVHQSVHPPRKF